VPGDHGEVQEVRKHEHREHGERESSLVGWVRVLEPSQGDPADQRERRVGDEVAQQVGTARPAPNGVAGRGEEADGDRRGWSQHGHCEDNPKERSADPEALGVEDDEVAAQHEHDEQSDELPRLPLVSRRYRHGHERDHHEQ
jgi:hypothetical protein